MLCYMYKMHMGIVPDLGFLSDDTRNGPAYFPKFNRNAPEEVREARLSSFFVQGPKLFNMLPLMLRKPARPTNKQEAKKLFDTFKRRLDKWLELIPDEPHTGRPVKRATDPNSIEAHMAKLGVQIKEQWAHVQRQIEREEAAAAKKNASETTTDGHTNNTNIAKTSRKRRGNHRSQLTDDWEERMKKKRPTWDD